LLDTEEMVPSEVGDGNAGDSANQQYLKKSKSTVDKRISKSGPRLGKLANLYFGDTKSTEAWKKGALGEVRVGAVLDEICHKYGFKVLHDRKVPKSVGNIDHILITDRGVFVIDSKNYKGIVRIDQQGGLFSPLTETLYVGSRKQTKLVEAVKKQVMILTQAFEDYKKPVSVFGVLAFYKAEWPIFFKPKEIDGVLINSKGIENTVIEKVKLTDVDLVGQFNFLKQAFPAK
jgi:hypothetical protein